ncbi:hypothetical protein PBY51_016879 [Eleginops maclovinus]|uniref:Uncharacterized protein n=1 Tax=Eleginops maclovinus TaxID=56733 RepID=A0AAN7WR25_ELEMC|nr:hypothetical protein PBY51_016879 [Eleginops maclovinus]
MARGAKAATQEVGCLVCETAVELPGTQATPRPRGLSVCCTLMSLGGGEERTCSSPPLPHILLIVSEGGVRASGGRGPNPNRLCSVVIVS